MRKLLLCITLSLAGWAAANTQKCDDAFASSDFVTAYKECLPLARQGDGYAQAIIGYLYDFGVGGLPQDYTQAATWYQLAVQQNVALAFNNLGELYQYGLGVPQSDQKAFELFQKSSAQGNRKGQYLTGTFYELGKVTQRNYNKAVELYQKSANQGYPQAQNALGYMYENGYGVKRDVQQALNWYRKAADQGHAPAQYNVGYVYSYLLDPPNYPEAFKWIQKAAAQGQVDALVELGYMYQNGLGVTQDARQAIQWYNLAIDKDNARAYNNLGLMYRDGEGVQQDHKQALQLFQKATDLGSFYGPYNLAYMYYYGLGTAQDYSKAFQYFGQAAAKNYDEAQNYMGILYQFGRGVKQDHAQAIGWYQKAADQNNKYALYNLAFYYVSGTVVKQDYAKAAEYYRRSAEAGYGAAAAELGIMYLNGEGVPQDDKKALALFQQAAEAGDPKGQNNLGYMYDAGLGGIKQDYQKAAYWYEQAANQNYLLSISNLGLMYENGSGVPEDPSKAFDLYMKAAEQDDAWSQYRVGYLYFKGKGVTKDLKKAEEWLRKAVAQGSKEAQSTLDLLLVDAAPPSNPNTNTPNTTVTTSTPPANQIQLEILDPKPGAVVAENWVFLKVRTSKPVPNLEFRITVNGKPIGTNSRAIGITAATDYELAVPLDADAKTVNIEILAYQGGTLLGQNKLTVAHGKDNKNQFTPQGNLYILAVGIDEYKYVSKDRFLKYSVKDATDIVGELKKQQGIVYNNVYDFSLFNSQATWENIQAAMIRVQKLAKPEDTVIAFFSGHGEQMDGRYYVITYDTDPQYLRRTGLMQDELTEFYAGLQANTIVILDTCRAGGINGVRAISNPKMDGLVRALETTSNANPTPPNVKKVIFAATGGDSYAYEDTSWGNGAFTKAFLEALRGEKTVQNSQGLISILRLGAYLGERVPQLTGGKQIPNIQLSSSDWVIADPE